MLCLFVAFKIVIFRTFVVAKLNYHLGSHLAKGSTSKYTQAQSAKADTEIHIYIISIYETFSSSTLQVKDRGK